MDLFYHTHRTGTIPLLIVLLAGCCAGAGLEILPEHLRPDPFGSVVKADLPPGAAVPKVTELRGARGGYISFHLVVKADAGDYTLGLGWTGTSDKLQADAYREWFHFTTSDQHYYPDALVPVKLPYHSRLPEPDNRVQNQTAQAFWIDLWIPPDARPGSYKLRASLESKGTTTHLPLEVHVLSAVIPNEDVVTMDHNAYGTSWIAEQFPQARARASGDFFESDELFRLIHSYHRIFYENRGIFHQLGYGHGGKVGPEFAPALEGSGRNRHIASWDLYDRHYGPLFDGSAFARTRRGAQPIPFVYLPINPEWPAAYENWGEPAYRAEFVKVVSAMEQHFREKGWTHTRFEMFFNHKKRYMGFSWDGDEVRFLKDEVYFREFGRLLKEAVPASSPVHFVFRADVSWAMEHQFQDLAGILNMWVCSGGILSWYPEAPAMLRKRGDVIWYYSGPPEVTQPASTVTRHPLQAWLWGVNGYVDWLTVDLGHDPWFHFEGGQTTLVYSGDRFGLAEPIPSIRLKLQRNAVEDLALLESFKGRYPLTELKAGAAEKFNHSKPADWWNPRPKFANLPPDEWAGADIEGATRGTDRMLRHIDPSAWQNVRDYIFTLATEQK